MPAAAGATYRRSFSESSVWRHHCVIEARLASFERHWISQVRPPEENPYMVARRSGWPETRVLTATIGIPA